MKGRMTASRLRTDLHALVSAMPADAYLGAVLRGVQDWVERHRHELAPSGMNAELARLVQADVDRYPWTSDAESARRALLRVAGCGGSRAALAALVTSAFWDALCVVRDAPCSSCDGEVELLWAYEEDRTFWSCRRCSVGQSMSARAVCVPPRRVVERGAVLELTRDEAVVLLAWLARARARERLEFEDQAEQRVLWDMEAMLERQLVEPLRDDWEAVIGEARARVRDAAS